MGQMHSVLFFKVGLEFSEEKEGRREIRKR